MRALLLLLLCNFALGAATQITASGGSPIPTAFSSSNSQSQVMECKGNIIEVLNQSTAVLAVGFGTSSSTPGSDYLFIPPGPAAGSILKPMGGTAAGTYFYIRSAGTSITSGTVQVSCYFEDLK